jgi:pre-mRNA-splicing helicase BRR2
VFIGAPASSGKTVCAEIAMLRAFNKNNARIVYIAPHPALVTERLRDWQAKFGAKLGNFFSYPPT